MWLNIVWLLIIFAAAYLIAVLAVVTRAPEKKNPAANKTNSTKVKPTATPHAGSTPHAIEDEDSALDNALSGTGNSASDNADNAASESVAPGSVSPPDSTSALEKQ